MEKKNYIVFIFSECSVLNLNVEVTNESRTTNPLKTWKPETTRTTILLVKKLEEVHRKTLSSEFTDVQDFCTTDKTKAVLSHDNYECIETDYSGRLHDGSSSFLWVNFNEMSWKMVAYVVIYLFSETTDFWRCIFQIKKRQPSERCDWILISFWFRMKRVIWHSSNKMNYFCFRKICPIVHLLNKHAQLNHHWKLYLLRIKTINATNVVSYQISMRF